VHRQGRVQRSRSCPEELVRFVSDVRADALEQCAFELAAGAEVPRDEQDSRLAQHQPGLGRLWSGPAFDEVRPLAEQLERPHRERGEVELRFCVPAPA
jgi:hypothetical protein